MLAYVKVLSIGTVRENSKNTSKVIRYFDWYRLLLREQRIHISSNSGSASFVWVTQISHSTQSCNDLYSNCVRHTH